MNLQTFNLRSTFFGLKLLFQVLALRSWEMIRCHGDVLMLGQYFSCQDLEEKAFGYHFEIWQFSPDVNLSDPLD